MDKSINAIAAGSALAVTFAALSAVCAVAFLIAPGATLDFFGAFMHGIDLRSVRSTAPISLSGALVGIVGLAVIGFVAGVVFATVYNAIGGRST